MPIDDGSGNAGKCKLQIFKNITPALTIGDVFPDYCCHQYSNLTYPLGIGSLGCEYATLLCSLIVFTSLSAHSFSLGRLDLEIFEYTKYARTAT